MQRLDTEAPLDGLVSTLAPSPSGSRSFVWKPLRSGSPVINGRGELVGVNFDRVWENVANDFGYNPEVARNVSADVRYLLWLIETLGGERAERILAELGVGR